MGTSYHEIVEKRQQTRLLKLYDGAFNIEVTESTLRNPAEERANRKEIEDAASAIKTLIVQKQEMVDRLKSPDPKEDPSITQIKTTEIEISDMQLNVMNYEFTLKQDARLLLCKAIESRIVKWDLTDGKKPLPLDADKLSATDVPTKLLDDILTELNKEGAIPKASD
jgi:hypothetical protein